MTMITQEQADRSQEFHHAGIRPCDSKQGPVKLRRNGKTQRWKRDPERFRIPAKFGFYSYWQLTNDNTSDVHALADCPVPAGVGDYRNHTVGCTASYEHPGSCLDAQMSTIW